MVPQDENFGDCESGQAVLAKQREYGEPFVSLDPDRAGALSAMIEEQGMKWIRGPYLARSGSE